jgi:triacylglycerol lipase
VASDVFDGVADDLRARGELVIETAVAPYQSSEVRGAQLAEDVDRALADTGACKVNIIAHSQGGLDVRYMIGSLGYGDVVASVVTVSTPHRGTPLADIGLGLIPGLTEPLVNAIIAWLRVDSEDPLNDPDIRAALHSFSVARAASFAEENPDDPRVARYSIAGRTLGMKADGECAGALFGNPSARDWPAPILWPSALFLAGANPFNLKANDGAVTVASAKWGTFLGCLPADHMGVTSGDSAFDHIQYYRDLAAFLHDEGF